MPTARTGAAAALLALTCAAAACNRTPDAENPPAEATPAAPPATAETAPASATAPEPPKPVPATIPPVVARVNGEDIPKADFDRMIKQMEAQAGQAVPAERRDEIYRAVLDQIVTYTALKQEARSRGITVTDAEAKQAGDAKIAELRQQIPDEKAFNKAMTDRGMTMAKLRADIRNDLAVTKMMEAELTKTPPVSDADVKAFYEKNPDEFSGVRASHILIRPEGFDEASKKTARAKAEDLLKQARNGADFAALAKEHSTDGSAQQGGDLGFFTRSSMVKPFADAAFALQPGQISDVVETQFGFHIIKVAERKDIALVEATANIRDYLTAQQRDQRQQAFVAEVKNKSRIEVLF